MTKSKRSVTEADKYIGMVLRRTRIRRGLSQKALADALGLTFQQIQKYENGATRIAAIRLHIIADLLDVPYTIFFQADPTASPPPDLRRDHIRLLHHYDRLPPDIQALFIQAMKLLSTYKFTSLRRGL